MHTNLDNEIESYKGKDYLALFIKGLGIITVIFVLAHLAWAIIK